MFYFLGRDVCLFSLCWRAWLLCRSTREVIECVKDWWWYSFGTKLSGHRRYEQSVGVSFQVIGISIGRVCRFSTGFYGERPGQNQRTDRSIRRMRNNEESDIKTVRYVDGRGYAMPGTLTAQKISHKRCVAFVRTDWFCSTSCAGILVRPVLRSFRPKATPRAIYRYLDRVNNAARSKIYALGGVESAQCCPTNGAAEKTSSADVKMRRRKHIGGCLGLKLYIRSDEWRRVVDATIYAIS